MESYLAMCIGYFHVTVAMNLTDSFIWLKFTFCSECIDTINSMVISVTLWSKF